MLLQNLLLLILQFLCLIKIVHSCDDAGNGYTNDDNLYYEEAESMVSITPTYVHTKKSDFPAHMVPITGTHFYVKPVDSYASNNIILSREQNLTKRTPYYEIMNGYYGDKNYIYGIKRSDMEIVAFYIEPDGINFSTYVSFENFTISIYFKGENKPRVMFYDHNEDIFPIRYVGFYTRESDGNWTIGDEDRCWNLELGKNLKVGDHEYNQDCTKLTCVKGKSKIHHWKNYLIKYKYGKSYVKNSASDKCEIGENKYVGIELPSNYKITKYSESN